MSTQTPTPVSATLSVETRNLIQMHNVTTDQSDITQFKMMTREFKVKNVSIILDDDGTYSVLITNAKFKDAQLTHWLSAEEVERLILSNR